MADRILKNHPENNGLLHVPNCACYKCAAGRDSHDLDDALRERVKELLDNTFLEMVHGNLMGGVQVLNSGEPLGLVRSGFHEYMANIRRMREMAYEYFAVEKDEKN